MKNPLRFWRTGAVAVVLAAIGGAGFADDTSAVEEGSLQCLSSPYDVDETVHRIELSARHRGVSVFGCFEQRSGGASIARGHTPASGMRVVVLESRHGGTPVLMAAGGARDRDAFELPLSIRVRPGADGRSEVWVEAPQGRQDMLQELELDLAALGEIVRDALRA
ncbi:MAG: hypothetical protein ABI633_05985 [Burkholderiales bacterium]